MSVVYLCVLLLTSHAQDGIVCLWNPDLEPKRVKKVSMSL